MTTVGRAVIEVDADLDTASFNKAVRLANLELRRIQNNVKVGAKIDRASFVRSVAQANGILRSGIGRRSGEETGEDFTDGFERRARGGIIGAASSLASEFGKAMQGGIVSNPYIIAGVIAAISAAMPLAGTLAAGLFVTAFGAGIAGLGLVFAAQNAGVKAAFSDLGSDIAAQMRQMTEPLQGVLLQVVDTAADVFRGFAPALTAAFAAMAPALSGFVKQLGKAFLQLEPAIAPMTAAFNGILTALGPQLVGLFGNIGDALANMAKAVDPQVFATMLTGVLQIIPGLINFISWLTEAQAVMQPWYSAIADAVGGVISAYQDLNTELGGASTWATAFEVAAVGVKVAAFVIVGAMRIFIAAVQSAKGNVNLAVGFIQAAWARLGPATSAAWALVTGAVQRGVLAIRVAITTLRTIVAVVRTAWTAVRAATAAAWNAIRAVVVRVVNAIRSGVRSGVNGARSAVTSAWSAIRNVTSSAWNAIRAVVVRVMAAIRAAVARGGAAARAAIVSAWNAVRSATAAAWNAIKSAVTTGVNAAVSIVRGMPGKAAAAIRAGVGSLFAAGAALMEGFGNGILSKLNSVLAKARSVASKIRGLFPGSPIKEGPLKSWNNGGAGKRLMKMLADGIDAGADEPVGAAARMTQRVIEAMSKGGGLKKAIARLMKDFAQGVGNATTAGTKQAQAALAGFAKLIDKQLQKEHISKKLAKTLGREFDQLQKVLAQHAKKLAERAKFGKELTSSLREEFNLEGFAAGGIEGIIEGASQMAAQIRAFGRKLTALGKAGIPAALIQEVAGLGSSKGSVVADTLLDSTAAQRAALRRAYGDFNKATAGAGTAGANTLFGTEAQIARQLDLERQIRELRRQMRKVQAQDRKAEKKEREEEKKDKKDKKGKGDKGDRGRESVIVNQNYYGPTTSGGRLRELDWTMRFATKARRRGDARRPEGFAT